jgi:hypothetical protein
LIEEMIQAVAENFDQIDTQDPTQKSRREMLNRIEHVRNQYSDRIKANPWLQEQLAGAYWD